jgi:ribosomal protein S18 acetylase RimI-like enzyme
VEIRRGTEADLEALQRLWDASIAETTFTPYPGIGFDPSVVTTYTALVAEEDGDVLGTAYLNNTNEHFGFVFGVFVVPEARRRGVARRLMQEAARVARDSGRAYVVLGVDMPNEAARALYAGLGFEETARTLRAPVERLLGDAA